MVAGLLPHPVHSTEHHAMPLLSRRYDLTNMGYKFLQIGINVGPPSYVEIVLGDHRGHELAVSRNLEESTSSDEIFTKCFETNTRTIL